MDRTRLRDGGDGIGRAAQRIDPADETAMLRAHGLDQKRQPVYHQFAAELPNRFTWDYLEQGPEAWRVRIGRPDGISADARP